MDVLLRRPQTKLRLLIDCTHCRVHDWTQFIYKHHEMSHHPLPQMKNQFPREKQTLNYVSLTQRLKQTNTVTLLLKQRAEASCSRKRYLTKSNELLGSFMIPYKAWLFSNNSQWKQTIQRRHGMYSAAISKAAFREQRQEFHPGLVASQRQLLPPLA